MKPLHPLNFFKLSKKFPNQIAENLYYIQESATGRHIFVGRKASRDQVLRALRKHGGWWTPRGTGYVPLESYPTMVGGMVLGQGFPTWAHSIIRVEASGRMLVWGWVNGPAWTAAIIRALVALGVRVGNRRLSLRDFSRASGAALLTLTRDIQKDRAKGATVAADAVAFQVFRDRTRPTGTLG